MTLLKINAEQFKIAKTAVYEVLDKEWINGDDAYDIIFFFEYLMNGDVDQANKALGWMETLPREEAFEIYNKVALVA